VWGWVGVCGCEESVRHEMRHATYEAICKYVFCNAATHESI